MRKSVFFVVMVVGWSAWGTHSELVGASAMSFDSDITWVGDTLPGNVGGGGDDSVVVIVPPAIDPNDTIPSSGEESGDSVVVVIPPGVDPEDPTPPSSGVAAGDTTIIVIPDSGSGMGNSQNQDGEVSIVIPMVGNLDEFFAIDSKYVKDWQIRFATQEDRVDELQLGIRKDTLLNGAIYQMVERENNRVTIDSLYYRQVGDKVYRFSEETGQDVLLFDFSLKEGETFMAPNGEEWVVDQVDEAARIADHEGRAWVMKGKTDNTLKDIWQKGVGSVYTGILSYGDIDRTKLPRVAYCRQFDAEWLIYIHQFKWNEACYKIGFFRPESDYDREDWESLFKAEFIKDTLYVYGSKEFFPYDYAAECQLQGNNIHVTISDITNLPLDCMGWRNFMVKIPGFEAGNYNVVVHSSKYDHQGTDLGTLICMSGSGVMLPSATPMEMRVEGNMISCISSEAVMLEIYTPEAGKVGEAKFRNGKAAITVSKTPRIYLYVVTNKDDSRTSGKVTIK